MPRATPQFDSVLPQPAIWVLRQVANHSATSRDGDDAGPTPAEEVVAARAARLAAVAEAVSQEGNLPPPVYVISTEVPVPGGAFEALDDVEVTRP